MLQPPWMRDSICTCRSRSTSTLSCPSYGASPSGGAPTDRSAIESDSGLPGARHACGFDRLLDRQTGLASLRLCAQTARNRVEEGAHEAGVGMRAVELLLHPVDELYQIFLVAPRKCHPGHGALHGDERLVYGRLLLPVHHGRNLNPPLPESKPSIDPWAPRAGTALSKCKSESLSDPRAVPG